MTEEEIAAQNDVLIGAYRQCFGSPAGRIVMDDLMKFCRFRTPANNEIEEGQRRVFLRIVNMTNLTAEHLMAIYAGRDIGDINGETK